MTIAPEPTSPPAETSYPSTGSAYYASPLYGTPRPPVSPAAPGYDGTWGRTDEVPGYPPPAQPWGTGNVHHDLAVQHGWSLAQNQHRRPSSNLAVWALVTSIVGLLAGWCLFGLPCIAAVILGHFALRDTQDDRKSGRGMAVAGLVMGYVALIPAIILTVWVVVGGLAGAGGAVVSPTPSFT